MLHFFNPHTGMDGFYYTFCGCSASRYISLMVNVVLLILLKVMSLFLEAGSNLWFSSLKGEE